MNKDNAKDFLHLVHALADGKKIQISVDEEWQSVENYSFNYDVTRYRIEPEPEYPVTSLTKEDINLIYRNSVAESMETIYCRIANAAIKQAILDGDVILPESKK